MSEGSRRQPWWELEDARPTMTAAADELRDRDETRRMAVRIWDDLYHGRTLFAATHGPALEAISRDGFDVPRLNFARRAIDHVHSKVTSETPAVRALGHGADARTRVKARRLSKFIQGMYDDLNLEVVLPKAVLGVLCDGTGCTSVSSRNGRITVETVSPRELFVDPDDGRHGDPRCLYRIRPVDRRGLALQYPDLTEEILSAPASADPLLNVSEVWTLGDGRTDAVDLYDAWLLPRGAEPGRHIQSLGNVTLCDEDWTAPRFPIAMLMEREPPPGAGYWGLGMLGRLDGIQFEIDSLIAHIGESIRHANLKVFVADGADVVMDHLTDPAVGTIVMHAAGQVPQFITPEPVAQQEIEWLKYLVSQLYSMAGMDESGASSQKPAGINSGRALLFYHDFQSQTYVDLIKRYGRHVVDVVERVIDEARRLSADSEREDGAPTWEVNYRRGSVVRKIDWSEVDMDEDTFLLELEEVSPVPDSAAGRIEQIEQDAAAGRIPPEYLTNLREDPDRWLADRLMGQADADFVDDLVERLYDPDAEMPDVIDEMDKGLAAARLRTEVLHSIRNEDSSEVTSRLRDYLGRLVMSMAPPPAPTDPTAGATGPQAPLGGTPAGGPQVPPPPGPGLPQTNG